ncbi:MAG: O-antigen ligase family protein [Peptostreptococcaceae bacterium]|nr:O-antigen ligase family protein [Peptostreptococcaceae bacterium]
MSSAFGKPTVALNEMPKLDYLDTDGYKIKFSVGGNEAVITVDPENPEVVKIVDNNGKEIKLIPTEISHSYKMDDERFSACLLQPTKDKDGGIYYVFSADMQNHQWPLRITNNGVLFLNGLGALVDLDKVPTIGWENNGSWGSGRGYIFSRSIPMLKDTLLLGHGADTYCIYFPHKDYVGKYNAGIDLNMIFDKPHNMYLGMALDTGGLSFLAMLAFWGIYIVQSGGLYFRSKFKTFNEYVGAAIMFGVCGFMAAGFVNDSTVSTFPMFYGLLATGIAINYINKRNLSNSEKG